MVSVSAFVTVVAVVALAANGIGVAPGAPFRVAGTKENIRVNAISAGPIKTLAASVAAVAVIALRRPRKP